MVEVVQKDTELGLDKEVTTELHLKEHVGIGQVMKVEEDKAFQVGVRGDGAVHSMS